MKIIKAQLWQKDPESLKTSRVQLWGETMQGLITLEKAKQYVIEKKCFVISDQAIGFYEDFILN